MKHKLAKEHRLELAKFTHALVMRLRKIMREKKYDKSPEEFKAYCFRAAIRFEVHPKTIRWVLREKRWADLKPTTHLRKRPKGLGISDSKDIKDSSAESIDLQSIVKGNSIHIDREMFLTLNKGFNRGEIKRAIISAVRKFNLPAPMQPISQKQADESFNTLVALRSEPRVRRMDTCTRWEYKYPISDVVIDTPRTGNESSNFYHQESRWHCDYQTIPSPMKVWGSNKRLNSMLNAIWSLKNDKITGSELRTAISIRMYIASQFKPSAAKAFYELFNAKHVYDPSSGWGDRLMGFLAASGTVSYCSTDPNSRLYDGYNAQIERFSGNKKVSMYCHGSEIKGGVGQYGHKVDTVFTSPPYFAAEKYSDDEGQSFRQFSEIGTWVEGFLKPSLRNAWDILSSEGDRGGILAMNISDIFDGSKGERGEICDPMNDYISTLEGARYIGCIGLRLAKRPESETLRGKEGVSIEPIWIWAKGGTWELDDYLANGFKRATPKGLFE